MYQLSKEITPRLLVEHFLYFKNSLFNYADKYEKLIGEQAKSFHFAYLCPLCLKNYIVHKKGSLQINSNFNLDHVPPESVGGQQTIITCERCNNTAGTQFEFELIVKMNYEASRNGLSDALIEANFETSGLTKNLKSFLTKDEHGNTILDFPTKAKTNNPFLKNWLDNTSRTNDWEIKLTITRPDDKKVLKAILKAAYLICFINWGYDFAFSSNAELIRKVLYENEEYPLSFISFWFDENNLPKEVKLPFGLCRIEKPIELKTFIVNVPLMYKNYSSTASIIVPFAGEDGWKRLKELNELDKSKLPSEITFQQEIVSLTSNIIDGYSRTMNFLKAAKT